MELLHKEYEEEQTNLMTEFDEEQGLLITQHENDICDLQDIVTAMEQRNDDKSEDALIEFNNMRDEIKNKVTFF